MRKHISEKAVILRKGSLLVLRLYEKKGCGGLISRGGVDLPGGKLKKGEEPLVGLKREVFEETRLRVKPIKPVWQWFLRNKNVEVFLTGWLCKASGRMSLSEEHLSAKWIPLKELKKKKYPDWLRIIATRVEKEC